MKQILLFIIAIVMSFATIAQEKFTEGVIFSKQNMSSPNAQLNEMFSQMKDTKATTFFRDGVSRTEISNPMTGDAVTLISPEKMLTLMDIPGAGKVYMIQDLKEIMNSVTDVNVEEGSETKTFLGYECKQYRVVLKQPTGDMEMIMYVTEEIPVKLQQNIMVMDKVKGFPMYQIIKMNQAGSEITITTEVEKIMEMEVSEDKFSFTVPEGYTKM